MSNLSKPRIKLPDVIQMGDVIEIKTSITHVMETGNRKDAEGRQIPRNVINNVTAKFEGAVVFRATLASGIAANPYLSFPMKVTGPGTLELTWIDDEGHTVSETALLQIGDQQSSKL